MHSSIKPRACRTNCAASVIAATRSLLERESDPQPPRQPPLRSRESSDRGGPWEEETVCCAPPGGQAVRHAFLVGHVLGDVAPRNRAKRARSVLTVRALAHAGPNSLRCDLLPGGPLRQGDDRPVLPKLTTAAEGRFHSGKWKATRHPIVACPHRTRRRPAAVTTAGSSGCPCLLVADAISLPPAASRRGPGAVAVPAGQEHDGTWGRSADVLTASAPLGRLWTWRSADVPRRASRATRVREGPGRCSVECSGPHPRASSGR